MNGSYYQNPVFINDFERENGDENSVITTGVTYPMEQSYIENILRRNKGKKVRAHVSFSDSIEWRDRVFSGFIEEAGRDNLIISDPETGKWYLILMIYLDFVEFDEKIIYGK